MKMKSVSVFAVASAISVLSIASAFAAESSEMSLKALNESSKVLQDSSKETLNATAEISGLSGRARNAVLAAQGEAAVAAKGGIGGDAFQLARQLVEQEKNVMFANDRVAGVVLVKMAAAIEANQ